MHRSLIALFIAAVSTTALTHVALAADLPVKAPPPAPAPVTNWTGWYAGINFGVGFGTSNNATTTTTSFDDLAKFFPGTTPSSSLAGANSGTASLNQVGPIGGVQIGYNWQFAPLWVLGFEADIQGAAITSDRTAGNTGTATERFAGTSLFSQRVTGANSIEALVASFTNASITANGLDSVAADLNWFGTVRGRLGYLFTPNLLFYVTGGLAYGGVSVSATDTLNLTNLSADSFALAYGQASGPGALVTLTATTNPNVASADAIVNTTNIQTHQTVTAGPGSSVSLSATISGGAGTSVNFSGQGTTTPPTITGLATGSGPGQTVTSLTQASKGLSVALANTAQSFVHFSDTRVGGTIGGGFEWMMAPNWSFKAEALYYDLGSVTISTPITTSINPITAPIPATVAGTSTAGVTGAINKFTGSSTITNTATTHVNFQGVIVRVGLNYHFNFL